MDKILLITTENCTGCYVAMRNIKAALQETRKKIKLEIKDFHEVDKAYIKRHRIKDFPVACFIRNDDTRFIDKGSKPMIVYLRYIDIHFKGIE